MKKLFVTSLVIGLAFMGVLPKNNLVEASHTSEYSVGEKSLNQLDMDHGLKLYFSDKLGVDLDELLPQSTFDAVAEVTISSRLFDKVYEVKSLRGIQYFKNIKSLTLYHVPIASFPNEVFELSKLTLLSINLAHMIDMNIENRFNDIPMLNHFTVYIGAKGMPAMTLPESFYDSNRLTTINLNNIGLSRMDRIPNVKNNFRLLLPNNKLENLPENLLALEKNSQLSFVGNQISDITLEEYQFIANKGQSGVEIMTDQKKVFNIDDAISGNQDILISKDDVFKTLATLEEAGRVSLTSHIIGNKNDKDFIKKVYLPDLMTDEGLMLPIELIDQTEFYKDLNQFKLLVSVDSTSKEKVMIKSSYIFHFHLEDSISKSVYYNNIDTNEIFHTNTLIHRKDAVIDYEAGIFDYVTLVEDQDLRIHFNSDANKVIDFEFKNYDVVFTYVDELTGVILGDMSVNGKHTDVLVHELPKFEGYLPVDGINELTYLFDLSQDASYQEVTVYYTQKIDEESDIIGDLPEKEAPKEKEDPVEEVLDDKEIIQEEKQNEVNGLPATGVEDNLPLLGVGILVVGLIILILKKKRS